MLSWLVGRETFRLKEGLVYQDFQTFFKLGADPLDQRHCSKACATSMGLLQEEIRTEPSGRSPPHLWQPAAAAEVERIELEAPPPAVIPSGFFNAGR